MRINDDVTLTLDELLALPEEESDTMVTRRLLFAFPGAAVDTAVDLTPGATSPSASSRRAPPPK